MMCRKRELQQLCCGITARVKVSISTKSTARRLSTMQWTQNALELGKNALIKKCNESQRLISVFSQWSAITQEQTTGKQLSQADREAQRRAELIKAIQREDSGELGDRITGWYGVDQLVAPESFEQWRKKAEKQVKALRSVAKFELNIDEKKHSIKQGRLYLQLLDSMSARLCLLLDTAEVCSSSHSDPNVRAAAATSYVKLSKFVTKLNMDVTLYRPLATIVNTPKIFSQLNLEEQRVAVALKLEFERDGIHLSTAEKENIEILQAQVRETEAHFGQLERKPAGKASLSLQESGRLFIDRPFLQSFGKWNASSMPPSFDLNVDTYVLGQVQKYATDAIVRQKCFQVAHSESVNENIAVLKQLVERRQDLANALGFKSYGHLVTSYRMCENPENVENFLDGVSEKIKDKAASEESELLKCKQEYEPSTSKLNAWDVPFYTNILLTKELGQDLDQVSPYFTLENCLRGLKMISEQLFGLQFDQVGMQKTEIWSDQVRKLVVKEQDGTPVGVLYLDLYQRPGKVTNPCHFQVNCSHLKRPLRHFVHASILEDYKENANSEYQLPSSVLVCSFNQRMDAELQHSQVQTLFHEYGHALHSLLSRTQYQHLSGTRGELDFVETPSQLMEYFCFDERVLQKFALHRETNAPIPSHLVKALNVSRTKFQAMSLQQQILFAACDNYLFSNPKSGEMLSDHSATTRFLSDLQDRYTQIPHVDGTFWVARFSHFVNYGAAYYSYTYARMFAADLWKTCFKQDPLDRSVGESYRNNILKYGGSEDPHKMLESMLGRSANMEAFIGEINNSN